jgi:hypothetical protein
MGVAASLVGDFFIHNDNSYPRLSIRRDSQ